MPKKSVPTALDLEHGHREHRLAITRPATADTPEPPARKSRQSASPMSTTRPSFALRVAEFEVAQSNAAVFTKVSAWVWKNSVSGFASISSIRRCPDANDDVKDAEKCCTRSNLSARLRLAKQSSMIKEGLWQHHELI